MSNSILLALVLSLSSYSVAAQPANKANVFGGGVLVSVDSTAKTIAVRQGQHEQRYSLADLRVQDDKTVVDVDALSNAVGRYVTIRYDEQGDTRVATTVKILQRSGAARTTVTSS